MNYKTTKNYADKLKTLCPEGHRRLFRQRRRRDHRRRDSAVEHPRPDGDLRPDIAVQSGAPEIGPRWLWSLITKQARAEGFLVFQFADRFAEAAAEMAGWIKAGRLKYHEDIVEGFQNLPRAFIGMLSGDNLGKRLVKVADV